MREEVLVNFGKALRSRRKELKLSQEEFAETLGLSRTSITNLERGENGPSDSTLLLMEQKFGISREWSYQILERIPPTDRQLSATILEEIAELPDLESRRLRWSLLSPKAQEGAIKAVQDMQLLLGLRLQGQTGESNPQDDLGK